MHYRARHSRVTRVRQPARAKASTVDLSHDNVDAGVDGDDVREEMSLDHLRNGGEIDEGRRTDAPAHRLRRTVGYHIVSFLAFGAFYRDVGFAYRRTRSLHHDLEVMDHRLHLARRLRLRREDHARIVDVDGPFGQTVGSLLQNADRLTQLLE